MCNKMSSSRPREPQGARQATPVPTRLQPKARQHPALTLIGFVDKNRAASHQNLTTNQHGPDDPYPPKLGERGSTQAARPRPPNPRDTTAPPSPPPPPNTSPRGSSQKHGSIRLRPLAAISVVNRNRKTSHQNLTTSTAPRTPETRSSVNAAPRRPPPDPRAHATRPRRHRRRRRRSRTRPHAVAAKSTEASGTDPSPSPSACRQRPCSQPSPEPRHQHGPQGP